MTVEYRRDFSHNYMLLTDESGAEAPAYELRILMANRIPGLLPLEIERINDGVIYRYDITSCQPFRSFLTSGRMTAEALKKLYAGLLTSLPVFEDYLLDSSHLMLDPTCLFMHWETMTFRIPYVPFYQQDLRSSLISLTEWILMQTGHEMQESIVLACRILHELQNRDIQLADLMRVLEEDTAAGVGGGRREERPQRSAELSSPEEADAWSAESGRYAGELPEEETYAAAWADPVETKGLKKLLPGRKAVLMALSAAIPAALLFVVLHLQEILVLTDAEMAGASILIAAVILLTLRIAERITSRRGKRPEGKAAWKDGAGTEGKAARKDGAGAQGKAVRTDGAAAAENSDAAYASAEAFQPLYAQRGGSFPAEDESVTGAKYGEAVGRAIFPHAEIPAERMQLDAGETLSGREPVQQVDVTDYGHTVLLAEGSDKRPGAKLEPCEAGRGLLPIGLKGGEILIGKQATLVDEVIPEETVSRLHARIIRRNGVDYVSDMGSRNGTVVDGRPVVGGEEVPLTDGAHVSFAACRYVYRAAM